ncbi:ATP-binding protein [Streptomyces sp. NPDC090052]|uniref:ATP-binding protein n=1 Tax=unclassified Streptomyces TaxID=2593676 RepID=UPI00225C118C|nr:MULTISPECIES: ATP-binding protein [unclassified Streptomyces]MCX4728785.1 ATP-binding protein [Streptomyces sp. NBC_01306]WSV08411.1 ATP-binding protein [Streptomyces sp. NBC_01020]WSX46490.1 ATP-binding protein [Streptomyces sp. NBC_00963]WSX65434.1 ATP-binding protein [Streptomyces sp. NBC_00932]
MITEASREYVLDLEATPDRVPQVRRIVAAHLRHWQLDALIQPVSLGVCELLTNVHLHAGDDKRCTLELRWTGRSLTAAVLDTSPRLPQLRCASPLVTHGRGLPMVSTLSDSWGTHATEDGKVVWFTIRAQAATGSPLEPRNPLPAVSTAARSLVVAEPSGLPQGRTEDVRFAELVDAGS